MQAVCNSQTIKLVEGGGGEGGCGGVPVCR